MEVGEKWRGPGFLFEIESTGLVDELDVGYEGKEGIRMTSRFWFEQLSG